MMNALRLRLAQLLAPAGVDVHDPDETACPPEVAVLKAAEAYYLWPDPSGGVHLDVTEVARDAEAVGWIERTTDVDGNVVGFELTGAGRAALRQLDVSSR